MKAPSLLFVPGNRPERYLKAQASGAGALILDLEDSVPPAAKAQAREAVGQMLQAQPAHQAVWVRVNPAASGLLLQDLAAVVPGRPFGIVLPKCCGRAALEPVSLQLDALEVAFGVPQGSIKILAIATETGASMFHLGELAGVTSRLWGITWGAEDLARPGRRRRRTGQPRIGARDRALPARALAVPVCGRGSGRARHRHGECGHQRPRGRA